MLAFRFQTWWLHCTVQNISHCTDSDSGMDSDSDSKPDGYIVLCRTFHIAQTRTQVWTRIRIPNLMATLYCAEHFTLHRLGLRYGLGFRFQTWWLHCTVQNISHCTDSDSGMGSDSGSKPDGYIVLCRNISHCTDSDSGMGLDSGSKPDGYVQNIWHCTDSDSGMGSDSGSKPDGYIVLCRTFHIAQTRTQVWAWIRALNLMATCRTFDIAQTRTQVWARIRVPNLMATLYCAEHFTLHRLGLRYGLGFGFQTWWLYYTMQNILHRLGLGSLLPISESVPESVSSSVNEPKRMMNGRPTWWMGRREAKIDFLLYFTASWSATNVQWNTVVFVPFAESYVVEHTCKWIELNTVYFWNGTFLFLDNHCCLAATRNFLCMFYLI